MRRCAVFAVVLLTLLAPGPVLAGDHDDAEALIKQGLLLRRQGKDAEALAAFRRAFALEPSGRGRAQIALAEQALGRWVEAEGDLVQALGAGDEPWIATNRGLLESGLTTIRGHLGWLSVTADAEVAELSVNDVRAGSLPLAQPLRLEAGSAVIEVRAPGHASVRRVVAIEPGGSAREVVHLVALAPPDAARVETPRSKDVLTGLSPREHVIPAEAAMRNAGYVVGGAGIVGLAAATYFGVQTFEKKSQRDGQCPGGACSALGVAYDGEARTSALRSTAWFIAGILAAGSGVGLWWVSRSRTVHAEAGALEVTPDVGPDRASVTLGGSF